MKQVKMLDKRLGEAMVLRPETFVVSTVKRPGFTSLVYSPLELPLLVAPLSGPLPLSLSIPACGEAWVTFVGVRTPSKHTGTGPQKPAAPPSEGPHTDRNVVVEGWPKFSHQSVRP